jgi:hypothetical protein
VETTGPVSGSTVLSLILRVLDMTLSGGKSG